MSEATKRGVNYNSPARLNTEIRHYFNRPGPRAEGGETAPHYYFDMVNTFYSNLPYNLKQNIYQKYISQTTREGIHFNENQIPNLGYLWTVMKLRVLDNTGGSDSFFSAMSQGINIYNRNIDIFLQDTERKIIYNDYGDGDNLFDSISIRRILIISAVQNLNVHIANARNVLNAMNTDFADELNRYNIEQGLVDGAITIEAYNRILLEVYLRFDDRLLIINPHFDNVPNIGDAFYRNPFTVADTRNVVINFLLSPQYWIDNVGMTLITRELGVNQIIITRDAVETYFVTRAPQTDLTVSKYLFLLNDDNEYHLMTFSYMVTSPPGNRVPKKEKQISIFRIDEELLISPPIYIIFLFFSTYYINLSDDNKGRVRMLMTFLPIMKNSFDALYQTITNYAAGPAPAPGVLPPHEVGEAIHFIEIFNQTFSDKYSPEFNTNYPDINNFRGPVNPPDAPDPQANPQANPPNPQANPQNIAHIDGGSKLLQKGGQYMMNNYGYPKNYGYPNNYGYSNIQNYGYQTPLTFLNNLHPEKESSISYHITLDVEFIKGTSVTKEQIEQSKCTSKWNAVRKAFANFTGRKYVVKPVYSYDVTKKNYEGVNDNNITRKNYDSRYGNNNNDYGRNGYGNNYNDYGRNDYGNNYNDYGRNDYGRNDYGRNDYGRSRYNTRRYYGGKNKKNKTHKIIN